MENPNLNRDEFLPPENPQGEWDPIKRVLLINLAVLLAYAIILSFVAYGERGNQYSGMGAGINMIFCVSVHTAINLVLMLIKFVQKRKKWGIAFLLGAVVVAIVGFSACFGVVSFA